MRAWLSRTFPHRELEYRQGLNGRRLDAALWINEPGPTMDIALEWEWDHDRIQRKLSFVHKDFPKLFQVEARCGLAIVHTREDGRRSPQEANEFLEVIRMANAELNNDGRPVGLIEIRRTFQSSSSVQFRWKCHDLQRNAVIDGQTWSYERRSAA